MSFFFPFHFLAHKATIFLTFFINVKPVFLHGLSGFLNLLLLVALLVSWLWKKLAAIESRKRIQKTLFTRTLFCSFSAFNLLLCFFDYFSWYRNGFSKEKLVTLLDLALKTIAWGGFCVCLERTLICSLFFRTWCLFDLFVSCCCFTLDIVLHEKQALLPIPYLVSDGFSVCVGLLICCLCFLVKNEDGIKDRTLQEPLLNGDTKEAKGFDTVTPYSNAGFFSILTFSWIFPLIVVGKNKTLDLEDVPQLDRRDNLFGAFPNFKNKLEAYCSGNTNDINKVTTFKLVKSLAFTSWKEILLTAIFAFVNTLASYVGPYLINDFVQYLNGQRKFENEGLVLVSAFFVAKLLECITKRQWFFRLQQVGIRIQALLVTIIYNKTLTLSSQSKQGHTSCKIINFMTVDAERVGDFSYHLHDLWLVVLQILVALFVLYKNLGLASISGFVATIIVMLANVPLGSIQEKFQGKLMVSRDKRMKATSEILRNMRILKLQGWEMKFLSKITELRKNEEFWLKKLLYTLSVIIFVFWSAPAFVSVVTFGTCLLIGVPLESGKILSSLATFQILQEPIYNLPETISMMAQAKVSLDRIASFLCQDDMKSDIVEKLPKGSTSNSSDIAIEVVDGNFSWDLPFSNLVLKNINLKIFHGTKVAICGTVGSGKSTLLSCILGEVPKISGVVKVCGIKAYVAQSPWIQSSKIEDNILFGKDMERERYEKVLEACSLKKDLEILSFGDQTMIGERGINLSGGQKQRIQIARALYQDADIYLFDDPFSALDAHTGTHLFKECLLGFLSSKTVIYVTHQVEFLPAADLILVMKDGEITQCGKYNDLLNSGTDFMKLVGAHREALSALDSSNGDTTISDKISTSQDSLGIALSHEVDKIVQNAEIDDKFEAKGQIVQEEEREKGKVGFSVYWKYITIAYGGALIPFILIAEIMFQLLQIGSNYWMASSTPISKDVKPTVGGSKLLVVYAALSIGSSLCVLARAILVVTAGYKTATLLFTKMHLCIFHAPMSFFDATPSGRILNRASTDQSAVDINIPFQTALVACSVIHLLGIIAVMCQVAWQVIIVFVPMTAICIWYQKYYIPSGRELSRLVGVCKAPVIQHFAETISGTSTIRSFDQVSRFEETNMKLTDGYSRPNEPPLVVEENRPQASWPLYGTIDIHNLQVRYAPHMPLVLRGLTCTFDGGLKTGIVGRTGSGKSTLIQALFRIVEPSFGTIMIDGINISSIGLHDLRSKLSIIPQDPTMFEGNVRSNLDPLEEYTDEQIWEALDKCQLGDEVRRKDGRLDSAVSENGENWSMGQRQLVCLSRVLLKKSKVLVLDEATASVDTATDTFIQQTLKQHFSDCTVITIAHRITSVIDSDMVLLLNQGLIEEYDSPTRLLENKLSSFAQLVAEYTTRSNFSFHPQK
ncbi:ABC transporter C family member 3-like isoform X3 [Trifolium pratense]|uniref:ABC transporter C family member 3-like isoform X3 n=1 Tax=Trifolium pratense TaxID=57577 RepID=UPI001E69587A|nr:ABC transporter C family member 3-like isoform X3 [Trifolium pratense]